MTPTINPILTLVLVGLLVWLIYFPWQWACTDWARERVFAARDAIFDLAADGRLDFDSSEYRTIRRSLNALIRHAHELTLPRYVVMAWATERYRPRGGTSDLTKALNAIHDSEVQQLVRQRIAEAHEAVIHMMIQKSLLGVVFWVVLALASKIIRAARNERLRLRALAAESCQIVVEEADRDDRAAALPLAA